jgi:TPM domain
MNGKQSAPPPWLQWPMRVARHLWLDAGDIDRLLGPGWDQRMQQAIDQIETHSSAELRLCVEAALPWSWLARGRRTDPDQLVRDRALSLFGQLRVWDTEHNSGVLIYVLLAEHAIEIVADRGLREIPSTQWQQVASDLAAGLRTGQQDQALLEALRRCGQLLSALQLPQDQQGNELPNTPFVP